MTVYNDIYNLRYESSDLLNRTVVAIAKAARDIFAEDLGTANHANRIIWARSALGNTKGEAERFMWAVLADATVRAAGEAATDAQIQNAVSTAVDSFAIGV